MECCVYRKPVECGSVIRLQHLQTHLYLHSHNFRSPLSHNQEVSCFGDGSQGDEGTVEPNACSKWTRLISFVGDNWVLECGQENWSRDEAVRFKHFHTNA